MIEWAAAGRGTGVVHQHVDRTKCGVGTVLEAVHFVDLADIRRHGDDLGGRQQSRRPIERVLAQIGEHKLHAERREALGGGKADAARSAGDDRDATLREGRMIGHLCTPSNFIALAAPTPPLSPPAGRGRNPARRPGRVRAAARYARGGVFKLTVTFLRWVKLSSMPSSENSRPMPLCL